MKTNWQEFSINFYEKADGMVSISVDYAVYDKNVKNENGVHTYLYNDCFSKVVNKATADKLRRANEKGWF